MENLPEGFTLDTPGLPSGFTLDTPEPEKKDQYPMLAAAADVPLSFSRGVVGGIQMISDAFGANSEASKALSSADTFLADLMSAQSKKDAAEVSRIMQEAQDKGMLDQVKAGIRALSVAPVDLLTNALGYAAPTIVATLAASVAAPVAATTAGASAATAATIGTGATIATGLGVGAISGAGTIKNRIYSDVYQTLKDNGLSDERAAAAAQEAQSYDGKNLDNILLGALFGAGASVTGVERIAVKSLASKILGNAAKESAEVIAAKESGKLLKEAAGETIPLRFTKGFVREAVPEAGQEAQEQIASNIALQREGEDVPTSRGAAGAATLAGIAGGILGGGLNVAVGPRARTLHPESEDRALIEALKTIQDYKRPEEFFRLAEEYRDRVPVLGEILDSGISQDKKLEQIFKRLGEVFLNPESVIVGGGPRSLPAPQGERPTRAGVSEFYNAAIDEGAPLTDLSIDQGPNGFRILSGSENVIADGINSERDANVLLEGLRRAHDENNYEKYRNMLSYYDTKRRKIETEALAKAARETKTPFQSVTMENLRELAGEEDKHLLPMIQLRRQRTGQDMNADITIPELREMGVSKVLMDEIIREQKPYSMGTGKVKPGLVEEELGPRPSAPSLTARTEKELEKAKAKGRVLNTGNFPEVETEFSRAGKQKEGKPAIAEKPKMPVYPKFEDVQKARSLVEDRLSKLEKRGDQGVAIAKGVREAMASNEFDPSQLSHAFALADISASLLGDTKGVHDISFVNKIVSREGYEAVGSRTKPRENINGLIQLSLDPKVLTLGRSTAAHEAFHVLQDLFAENDRAGAAVIKNAFKGAKTFDDIDSNLLRSLKNTRDPDSNQSVYDRLKKEVGQDVLDSYDQDQREREMQAYVFGALDNSIRRGAIKPASLGAAFTRFLNYFRNFVTRAGNYLRGQGFQTAEDVMRETSAGTRQAGVSQAAARVTEDKSAPEQEYSSTRLRRGTKTLEKYGIKRGEKKVKPRRLIEVGDESPEVEEEFSRAAAQTGENVEEFKKWWGNSKSGVVYDGSVLEGREQAVPARWFHTTKEQFTKFDKARAGSFEDKKGPFFFTRSLGFLNRFNLEVINNQGDIGYPDGQRSIPVFLSVQNPFDFENKAQVKEVLKAMGPAGKSAYFKEGLKTGDWDIIELREIQKAFRNLGYDGFFIKEFGAKNLAVFDPKQIKSVFNEFAPGTASSEEFSRAIASTGQQREAEVNSNRFGNLFDGIREFFKPFALVKNVEELFELRNVSMGTITKSEQFARKMSKIIGGASQADRDAVYKYMTTRNADASMISNEKVRNAAMQSKKEINILANKMIEQGQLTKESFDKYYDQYLPRLYLYYELTGRGMKTPMGGKSVQEYLKARNDELSEEDRAILGEIKDPAFLVYVALSRPARDLAMIKYLNNIYAVGEENGWIAPQTTVEWRGNKMTPYDLNHRAEEMRKFVLPELREQDPSQADIMEKEIFSMKEIADEGIESINSNIKTSELEGFKQMPAHERYGPLAGAVVKKAIYDDLVGTFIPIGKENQSMVERLFGDENSALVKGTQLWKLGKTTLNPPTQITNAISNAIALNLFGGVPLHQFPRLFRVALEGILKNSDQWNDAQDFGLTGATSAAAELRAALTRLKAYQFRSGKDTSLIGMFASVRSIMSAVAEGATDAYQFSETLFKFMHYVYELEKAGPNPTERQKSNAVNAAHDTLFDYSLVNPNIRYARNSPIGVPFITYYYKVLPKLVETMVKTPWRFIPYIAMAYAIPMATMATFDIDEDEVEKLRKSMADYIRDSGSLYFLPIRDSKGNIEYIDVSRFFPFSSVVDPFVTAFKYGEYKKGAKELIQPILPSGPLITTIAALTTSTDPFTQKKIYNEFDTPKAKALSMLSYVWNQAMPPAINIDLNNMDHSGGALPRIYNALFVDGTGVDKRGLPKPEMVESMLRLFGANVTPLDAQKSAALSMLYMQNQITRTKALQTQVSRDQSLTPEARRKKIKELSEEIKNDTDKLIEYAKSVAGVSAVAEKIRKAP